MNPFIQIAHGVVGAAIITAILVFKWGFAEARHPLSFIGAGAIILASTYFLRVRFIRWGKRQTWLKYHQRFASLGLCLVLVHSTLRPFHWHSWLTLGLAMLNLGTGLSVALTQHRVRRYLLRCHLALAPLLIVAIVVHGWKQLDHDAFFPLTDVHDVACASCHTSDAVLFSIETFFEGELAREGNVSDDVQWQFSNHNVKLSSQATVSPVDKGERWRIDDRPNGRTYRVSSEDDRLNIYTENPYRANTCLTCHEHNTPEIQFAHEVHGVFSFNACLSCHQTEINGRLYGDKRANWDY